jgi:diacylglycerol kinase (ATP)
MLGIIINPKSGKRAFRAQRIYLWKLLRKRHMPFAYRVTKFAGHAIELARELVEKGYDEILVLGGDGTLSEVVNGIMCADITPEQRAHLQIGLMPRGTGNDWGRYWNLSRDFKDSLRRFFDGEGHPIDIGCVTYWRNNIEHHRYFINSVGFGVDPLCCKKAETLKYYIGSHHVNYLFGLIAAVIQHKAQHMILTVDGVQAVDDFLFTMNIGNGPFSGGGIRQNPEADPQDGVFNSMFICKPTFAQVCKALPNLFNGKLTELPFVYPLVGKEIEISYRKHILFEADGILMNIIGPCKVTCIHHALQFRV